MGSLQTTVRSSTTFEPGMYFYSKSIDQPRIPQAQHPWPASNTVAPSSNSNFSRSRFPESDHQTIQGSIMYCNRVRPFLTLVIHVSTDC
ncbi:hypothetical protein FRX31_011680 [Thalictrum thalictroides]|uniref:Uncharacterized protein n=1 Tax=Thalictrum thalictroides TaxID=46969 RepID=A0A7J6WP56_THATH|nr:hypothetical protein FRX31_011680 [Thalictrum thalictroides]